MNIVVVIIIVSVAIAAPWATISAFESSRLTGWTVTFTAIMANSKEAMFLLAAPWAAYEFILSFIPMGIGEEEAAAEAAANKG